MNKIAHGGLPSLPTEVQARSVTNPVRDRANSFTRDDERRAFSGGYAQPPPAANQAQARIVPQGEPVHSPSTATQSNHPPALQVSTQIPTLTGLRRAVQPSSPSAAQPPQGALRGTQVDEPQSGTSSKYSEATSKYSEIRTPSSDFQTRRDFSPSAVPPPLQTRNSPGPQSAATESPSSRFPPRKSSISLQIPLEVFQQPQATQELNTAKPWTGARSSSPGAAALSPATPGKGLPFIRPADIYRRMEEEREKERQSIDSSRPSMESIAGGHAGERSSSPANPPVRVQSSSDSLGGSVSRGSIQESQDIDDSSQHLAPMLEPIQERKSEYGFEGYEPAQFIGSSEEKTDFATSKESQAARLRSPEEIRRFSTSPKLPDLNRISGFGLDLFSQSSTDETSFQDSVLKSIPESSPSTYQNESELRTQPSLGFTSVVKQAFNAENSPIPDTPVSLGSSRVERTGSESTSTAGISPIMSRLPSTTPANTLDRELGARENITPSIAEVDEPHPTQDSTDSTGNVPERWATPVSNKDIEEPGQHSVHPIHRSNVSTPSPSNSPARKPIMATTERFSSALEGRISTTPHPAISPVEEDLPEPSRLSADHELSFRPNLPGGWVSYTTTGTNSTTEQEPRDNQRVETYNRHTDPMDVPVSPISESEEEDNNVDLTPSTAKRPLLQSALGAVPGAALGGVASATFERRDEATLSSPSGNDSSVQGSHMIPGNSALPTPHPALAPFGNPYAVTTLDPRLQDEQSVGNSALAVPKIPGNVTTSITSTEPPTPPPKDTPADKPVHGHPEYFPPTVPLKHKTLDEMATTEGLIIPTRPQMLPTLSTQTSSQDEESDKLRKEIIKSLNPNVSDAESEQRLAPPEISNNTHTEDSTALGVRESTYLPSEYDNYWESTNEAEAEERESEVKTEESGLKEEPKSGLEGEPEPHQLAPKSPEDVQDTNEITPPIPILSPQRAERASMEMPPQRPPLPSNRFSWEAGPEEVSSTAVPNNAQLQVPSSGIDPRYATTPDSQLRQVEQTREPHFEHGPITASGNSPDLDTTPAGQFQEDASLTPASNSNDPRRSGGQESSPSYAEKEAAIAASGTTGAAAYAGYQTNQHSVPQRRLSLAEEKNPANASTYAVSPTPPEDEHPARVSQPTIPPSIAVPATSSQPEGRNYVTMFRQQQKPDVTKIMQFRDILAFQNTEQRIRAYNDTRNQFATVDTGLTEWLMAVSINQRDSFSLGSRASPVTAGIGAERSKVPKSNQSSVPGTPLQQPYYQQYLNASPISSVPPMTRPGTGITSGSQQGFSPSGSKLSGQQVQTKSKDLLHSAGVFGGKASKAGKGLFAKGKNKLRGSGGGDKVD